MSTRIAELRERLKLQEQELEQQQARHAEELAEQTQRIQDRVAEAIRDLFAKTNESIHEDDLLEGIQMAIHPASGKRPKATGARREQSSTPLSSATAENTPSPTTPAISIPLSNDGNVNNSADPTERLAAALRPLLEPRDRGKRLPVKAPDSFDGSYSEFHSWWKQMKEYIEINAPSAPTDKLKIMSVGTFFRGTALHWYHARQRELKSQTRKDSWADFKVAVKERFTDQARIDKDHDKMLALRYQGDIQDYLARIQELNSRVDLSGRALRKIIKTQLTPEMHAAIYNKYGCIPTDEAILIKTVREIGLIQEEILRTAHEAKGSLRKSANKSTTDMEAVPRKETERSSGGRKAVKAKDNWRGKGPVEEPAAKDGDKPRKDFSHLRLCWKNAGQALKGVDQASIDKWKAANKSCIRCGGDNHQSVHCHRKKNIDGQELPPAPEPTGNTGTNSTASESVSAAKKRPAEDSESESDSENTPRTTCKAPQAKKAKTAAAQRKIWAIESDTDA